MRPQPSFDSTLINHYKHSLPGFNNNVYQEGGGGLGSVFSAVSRILLPASTYLLPGLVRGTAQLIGSVLINHAETAAKSQLDSLFEKARYHNSRIQQGRGKLSKTRKETKKRTAKKRLFSNKKVLAA